MYVDVKYVPTAVRPAHRFILTDTDFTARFTSDKYYSSMCVVGLISVYESHKLLVPSNLARHYISLYKRYGDGDGKWLSTEIKNDMKDIERHNPRVLQYFPCIVRQIRQLTFGRYATPIV